MSYFKGFGTGSNSNGQFWYGGSQGFPGFLFKKNTGVGGRKNPLYGLICNKPTYIYNKFKPGTGGVGAQNRANRRAKNTRATVCADNNCGRFYNYLGLYPRFSYRSIDGYFPYPLPITYYVANGDYRTIIDTRFKNLLVFTGNASFSVLGIKPITLNYIFVGGGGGGGAGGNGTAYVDSSNKGKGGGGGGAGGGGEIRYGRYDIYPGYYSIVVGSGGSGGVAGVSSTSGGYGGNTYIYDNKNGNLLINAYGGQGGFHGNGGENAYGGIGGVSTGTNGSSGGNNSNETGGDGAIGGGGGGTNYTVIQPIKGGDGANNVSINDINFINAIQIVIQNIAENKDSFENLEQFISILNENTNIDYSQIFGTGGGAGNAGEYDYDAIPSSISKGGRGGKAGGITVGLGGIGHVSSSENGEDGFESIPYLGGGGGGGAGGAGNGVGGNGSAGGSGSIILFFSTL
jgi:hypothetical protein